jgi:hypothetical protein
VGFSLFARENRPRAKSCAIFQVRKKRTFRARAGLVLALGDPDVSRSLPLLLREGRRKLADGQRLSHDAQNSDCTADLAILVAPFGSAPANARARSKTRLGRDQTSEKVAHGFAFFLTAIKGAEACRPKSLLRLRTALLCPHERERANVFWRHASQEDVRAAVELECDSTPGGKRLDYWERRYSQALRRSVNSLKNLRP